VIRGFRGRGLDAVYRTARHVASDQIPKREADFLLLVRDYLTLLRIPFRRVSLTGIPIPVGNGLFRLRPNSAKGMSDIVLCWRGRYVAIELKATKGKQSPEQIIYQHEIEDAGGVYLMPCGSLGPLRLFFEGKEK
jgi:hypothetical protein